MPPVRPYAGNSEELLTAIMNETSGTSFVYDQDFTFGTPVAVDGAGGRNTQIEVFPTNGGSVSRHQYWRLDLAIMKNLDGMARPEIFQFGFRNMVYARNVLDEINELFGLNLRADEIENTQWFAHSEEPLRLIITNSVHWLPGSYYEFEWSWSDLN